MAVKDKTNATPRARIDLRTEPHVKAAVEQAASLVGQNVSDFVTGVLYPHAQDVIEQHRTIRLTREESRLFLEALDNPAPVSAALRRAAQRYQARYGKQSP